MANKKNYYYVLVFTNEGPVYVTSVDNSNKMCHWNEKKKPYEFGSKSYAEDIALGLNCNMNSCVMVCSPYEIDSHPYNYEYFDCKFEKKEK